MKVVINRCFGGFGLSDAAAEECIKRGMKVTRWAGGNLEDKTADFVYDPKARGDRYWCPNYNEKSFRCHPVVVEVVEALGKEASNSLAELKVVDIPFSGPDGWHIDDYDGMETVHADHATWD